MIIRIIVVLIRRVGVIRKAAMSGESLVVKIISKWLYFVSNHDLGD